MILDEDGNEIDGEATGALAIKKSWPGQMRTVYEDHQRFVDTYFRTFRGYYFTGMALEEIRMVIIGLQEELMML